MKKDVSIVIPTSPEDRKRIADAIKEISNSKLRMEAEADLIKEIIQDLSDDFDLPKPYLNQVATAYHKQNLSEQMDKIEEVEALYETLFKTESEF